MTKAIVTPFYWLVAFFSTKTFEDMTSLLGWHGSYWLTGVICIWAAVFAKFIIPETKYNTNQTGSRAVTNNTSFDSPDNIVILKYKRINVEELPTLT